MARTASARPSTAHCHIASPSAVPEKISNVFMPTPLKEATLRNRTGSFVNRDVYPYLLTVHTYKNVASLDVATLRPAFLVTRFNAERTFSLDSASSAIGILRADPGFK